MKLPYTSIFFLIFSGLTIYLSSCQSRQTSKQPAKQTADDTIKIHKPSDNVYLGLRDWALNTTPEKLNLTIPSGQTKVFGVVMDIDFGEGTATFVSFETGEASMYLSGVGSDIGSSGHENVKNAAKAFVRKAQVYLDKTTKIDSTPLPDKGCVRFYLLTNKGRFTVQEQLENFDNNSSMLLPLFEEGNKVITEIKAVDEKMQKK